MMKSETTLTMTVNDILQVTTIGLEGSENQLVQLKIDNALLQTNGRAVLVYVRSDNVIVAVFANGAEVALFDLDDFDAGVRVVIDVPGYEDVATIAEILSEIKDVAENDPVLLFFCR
jgi:hypothetical protein